MKREPPKIVELDKERLEEILRQIEAVLNKEDCAAVKALIESYLYLVEVLGEKSATINRLRQWLFGAKTEKTAAVMGNDEPNAATPPPGVNASTDATPEADAKSGTATKTALAAENDSAVPRKGHGRNGADAYHGAEKIRVSHESLKPGDPCPECQKGTVYSAAPGVLVRITGRAPVQAKVYEIEKLRCGLCGKIFTAEAPAGVQEAEKHDATVPSMIALLKYGSGMPFNRLDRLQGLLGIPLPASTQWGLVLEFYQQPGESIYAELIRQAAQGDLFHNDDTTARILEFMGKRAKAQAFAEDPAPGSARKQRRGLFTTGIISIGKDRRIALFFTGRKYAGENLLDVLRQRAAELATPLQMCDALSRNRPGDFPTKLANCLTHGRRKFVELVEFFPVECRYVLETLRVVYRNDAIARQRNLSPQARLEFHQAESGPTMANLHAWLTRQFDERLVEPNSAVGKAVRYLRKHWRKLTLFLREPGAPLDNNICERALKKAILNRKNALFYKTSRGARVGDAFMSLIYTCEICGADPLDYLTALKRHAGEASASPQDWMPWNYQAALAAVTLPAAAG